MCYTHWRDVSEGGGWHGEQGTFFKANKSRDFGGQTAASCQDLAGGMGEAADALVLCTKVSPTMEEPSSG